MIENLLKFGRRVGIPPGGNQRLAAHVGRVQTAKIVASVVEAVRRQLIGQSDLELLHAVGRLAPPERGHPAENWYVGKLRERIFRKALLQIAGERFRSRSTTGKTQGKGGGVFDLPPIRTPQRRQRVLFAFASIPGNGFPHCSCGLVNRRRLYFPLLNRE